MATFSNIAGAEPSTVTFRVATVTHDRNGTVEHQEILILGDPESSAATARVLNAAPASTDWGVVVRQVGAVSVSSVGGIVAVQQDSTVWQTQARLQDSSGVGLNASTAAPATGDNGLIVRQVGYVAPSTTVAVSTGSVRVHQSTAADLLVTAYQSSAADLVATVRVQDGSGNAVGSGIAALSSGTRGLAVRPVVDAVATFSASTAGQSTVTTILSSNAASRGYVFAISVMSTLATPTVWTLQDGTTVLWTGMVGSGSSGVSGNNLAVSPPGYLFRNSTGSPLTFNVQSTSSYAVSLAYWVST